MMATADTIFFQNRCAYICSTITISTIFLLIIILYSFSSLSLPPNQDGMVFLNACRPNDTRTLKVFMAYGDSLTRGCIGMCYETYPYINTVYENLINTNSDTETCWLLAVLATPGTPTWKMIYDFPLRLKEVLSTFGRVDKIYVLGGTNDLYINAPYNITIQNLGTLYNYVLDSGAEPGITLIPELLGVVTPGREVINSYIKTLNATIINLDNWTFTYPEMHSDFAHFSVLGYYLWGQLVFATL